MIRNISVGIDVGTHATRVVVAELVKDKKNPKIIGTGMAESKGLRHGYVVNPAEVSKSVEKAVHEAEKNSGLKIRRAFASIGGISLGSEISSGSTVVTRADGEITMLDIKKAMAEAEEALHLPNKRILESMPIAFKLDGKEVLGGRPEGLHGNKLEVKVLYMTCLEHHFSDLIIAIEEAGVEVLNVIPSPYAASLVALNEKQKIVGCALLNIGAETTSLIAFENNLPIVMHVFSIGSADITNDIALGLRVPLEEAEGIKTGALMRDYPKKKLDQIMEARLSDIFELVDKQLKKINRSGLLPAGITLTGGGSNVSFIEDLSRDFLHLPSKVGLSSFGEAERGKLRDHSWFVAYGLTLVSPSTEQNSNRRNSWLKNLKESFSSLTRQLLP